MDLFEDPTEITRRRNYFGLTQKELAAAAGVARTWLVMVERGKINIGGNKARRSVKAKRDRVWRALLKVEMDRQLNPQKFLLSDLLTPQDPARFKDWQDRLHFASRTRDAASLEAAHLLNQDAGDLLEQAEKIMARDRRRIDELNKIVDLLSNINSYQKKRLSELEKEKDADSRVAELERQLAEVRSYYEAETDAALKHEEAKLADERAAQLRAADFQPRERSWLKRMADETINSTAEFAPEISQDIAHISPGELGTESTPRDENAESQPEKGPHKGGYLRRIGKLTARNYQTQEQLYAETAKRQAAEARLAELERANGTNAQHQPAEHQAQNSEQSQEIHGHDAEIARHPGRERYQQRLWQSMAQAGLTHEQTANVNLPNAVMPALLELENGPEITIYLAQHPDDCSLLMNMSGHQAVAYVGRLAERLESGGKMTRPSSQAPVPYKPVGTSSTKSSLALEDLPQREYNRIRNAQERARGYR